MTQEEKEGLDKIGAAFAGSAPLIESVLNLMESQPKKDESLLVDQISRYLCKNHVFCEFHKEQAEYILTLVKQF